MKLTAILLVLAVLLSSCIGNGNEPPAPEETEEEVKLTEEEIEPQTETLTLTASSIYNAELDTNIVKARCAESDDNYATWFSAVYQPTA